MDPTSDPDEVKYPVELVELMDLKTKSGEPFRVYAERVPEEVLVNIMRMLPGDSPAALPTPEDAPEVAAERKESAVRKWLGWAPHLLPQGTFLVFADGREVRPAFYFEGASVTHSIPGRYLSARDRSLLMNAILRLSGWSKEAAAPASFHGGDGAGGGAGPVPVGVREGVGADPVGSGA